MPKKKRKPRKAHTSSKSRSQTKAQDRRTQGGVGSAPGHHQSERLVDEFERWLTLPAPTKETYSYLASAYLDLKAKFLDTADPTVWTSDDVTSVLTELLPAKIVLEEDDRASAADAMRQFLRFLIATDRTSRSLSEAELGPLLDRLEVELPRVLADPARRSMSTNIMTFAISQGVDLADGDAMAEFMEAYNALSQHEVDAISRTGALPPGSAFPPRGRGGAAFGLGTTPGTHPGAAFGLGAPGAFGQPPEISPYGNPFADLEDDEDGDGEDFFDDISIDDLWSPALGPAPDITRQPEMNQTTAELAEFFDRSLLVTRAKEFLTWLGAGRPLTQTGALRRADTAEIIERLGLERRAPRSMWDVPELVQLWEALLNGDFITIDGTRVRPHAGTMPWSQDEETDEHRVTRGILLHTMVFVEFLDDSEGAANLLLAPYTMTVLIKAAEPDGFTVPERAADSDAQILQRAILADLETLQASGLVERDGETFRFPTELLTPLIMATEFMSGALDDSGDEGDPFADVYP